MKKYDLIIASGATICYNKLAKDFTNFKSGGNIDILIMPQDIESFVTALDNTDNPIILGGTTNSLISDSGIRGEVILTTNVKGIAVSDNIITVNCGETLSKVCITAKNNCLSGMEALSGIPGSVGGAISMNAGAYGHFISDILDSVVVYQNGEILTLSKAECEFGYRSTGFAKNNMIILSANFGLTPSNQLLISNEMKKYKNKRRLAQPNDISLGSVFKKYENTGAGYYIESCGLKGTTIGGAQVSEKHANFIINNGGATSCDYANLVNLCKNKVFEKFGISLDREVKYFGDFDI